MLVFLLWYNVILNREDLFPEEPVRSRAAVLAQNFSKDDRAGFFKHWTLPGVLPDIDAITRLLASRIAH
jgi:hypothetical protein